MLRRISEVQKNRCELQTVLFFVRKVWTKFQHPWTKPVPEGDTPTAESVGRYADRAAKKHISPYSNSALGPEKSIFLMYTRSLCSHNGSPAAAAWAKKRSSAQRLDLYTEI